MSTVRSARFQIGQVVRHRVYPFRGVIFDVDPTFGNTEEWYRSIPKDARPNKDQPFYHLLAENADTEYIAYVSEQNLVPDASDEPLRHPQVAELRLLRCQCQRAQDSAHQQSVRRHPLDHRRNSTSFRDLDQGDAGAIHVVKPALVVRLNCR